MLDLHCGNNYTNDRGRTLDNFIAAYNLEVVNRPSYPTTHEAGSHIDITFATPQLHGQIKEWRVTPYNSMSDHRLITFFSVCSVLVRTTYPSRDIH